MAQPKRTLTSSEHLRSQPSTGAKVLGLLLLVATVAGSCGSGRGPALEEAEARVQAAADAAVQAAADAGT